MGPNTQDKAERFMAATGHHLEDVMATCHTFGIVGEAARKVVQHPLVFFDSSGRKYCVVPRHRVLTSEFISVGDADALGHPQLFGAYESRRLPE